MIYILAGILTFPITAILTIAGVGAAFVLIPVFTALGIEFHEAIAAALLLNAVAMILASCRYARKKLVLWKIAVPFIITSCIGAPFGAMLSYAVNINILRLCFVAFLLFAAGMIFFYKTDNHEDGSVINMTVKSTLLSGAAGLAIGFISGLIGVGGGNIVLPILIALGIKPKEAIGTTAVIVIFSSVSGFISHIEVGNFNTTFIAVTVAASILGALAGSWVMTEKLKPRVIKKMLGVILIAVAVKMIINLL